MTLEVWLEIVQYVWLIVLLVLGLGNSYVLARIHQRLGPDRGALTPNDGLAVGVDAPEIAARDVRSGEEVRLSSLRGQRVVLVFLSAACETCIDLVPHLNRFAASLKQVPVIAVVEEGRSIDYRRELDRSIRVVASSDALTEAYDVRRAPLMYVVDEEGRITQRSVSNVRVDLEDTFDGFVREQGAAAWVPVEPPDGADDTET
jgi:peroxiredoxin